MVIEARMIGDEAVDARLRRMERNIEYDHKLLNNIGIYMRGSIDRNFRYQGRPRKWVPLSPVTLQLREHGGDRILEDTGHLRASIEHRVVGDHVEVGTNLIKARLLQFGDPVHRFGHAIVRIPPRPFVMIQDEDRDKILEMVKDWVMKT